MADCSAAQIITCGFTFTRLSVPHAGADQWGGANGPNFMVSAPWNYGEEEPETLSTVLISHDGKIHCPFTIRLRGDEGAKTLFLEPRFKLMVIGDACKPHYELGEMRQADIDGIVCAVHQWFSARFPDYQSYKVEVLTTA